MVVFDRWWDGEGACVMGGLYAGEGGEEDEV